MREKESGNVFAAKVVSKQQLCARGEDPVSALRERDILNRCKELNLHDVVTLHYTFQDEWSLCTCVTLQRGETPWSFCLHVAIVCG